MSQQRPASVQHKPHQPSDPHSHAPERRPPPPPRPAESFERMLDPPPELPREAAPLLQPIAIAVPTPTPQSLPAMPLPLPEAYEVYQALLTTPLATPADPIPPELTALTLPLEQATQPPPTPPPAPQPVTPPPPPPLPPIPTPTPLPSATPRTKTTCSVTARAEAHAVAPLVAEQLPQWRGGGSNGDTLGSNARAARARSLAARDAREATIELVNQLIGALTVLSTSDTTTTTVTIRNSPTFAGATFVITEYHTAKKQFHLAFHNLSDDGRELIASNEPSLKAALHGKGYTLLSLTVDTPLPEKQLV